MSKQIPTRTDLLPGIKARHCRLQQPDPDVEWLIGEIERLREEKQAQDATITGFARTIGYLTQALGEVAR